MPKFTRGEILRNRMIEKERKIKQKYGAHIPTEFTPEFKNAVFKRWGSFCYICGHESALKEETLELDHFWPEAMGGEHTVENVRPLCPRHHDIIGSKRGRNPFYLLNALFDEVRERGEAETMELDPAFSSLFLPDAQLSG